MVRSTRVVRDGPVFIEGQVALSVVQDLPVSNVGVLVSWLHFDKCGAPACQGFLAHLPALQQANSLLDQRLCGVDVYPRVDRLETNRVALGVGGSIYGGQCVTRFGVQASADLGGVCPLGKSAITRRCRTLSRPNRRFLARGLVARAPLPASSAGYSPSGPA